MNKLPKKALVLALILSIVVGSVAFASSTDLYVKIKGRLLGIADIYTSKDSALSQDGVSAQTELENKIQQIETEIMMDVSQYEQEQIEAAKQTLRDTVNEIKTQLDADKANIEQEIKDKIKDKIDSDLEKELDKLEKALEKIQ